MKLYIGVRVIDGVKVFLTDSNDEELKEKELNPRFDLANHSPTGFEWGYEGSGPSQLALAIVSDVLQDDQEALKLYQAFKIKAVKNFPKKVFVISDQEVKDIIESIKGE